MDTQKTKLQRIKEQLEEKLANAIAEAINDGATIEQSAPGNTAIYVDGVLVFESNNVVLHLPEKPEITNLFKMKSKEALKMAANDLRKRLEQIEKQIAETK